MLHGRSNRRCWKLSAEYILEQFIIGSRLQLSISEERYNELAHARSVLSEHLLSNNATNYCLVIFWPWNWLSPKFACVPKWSLNIGT